MFWCDVMWDWDDASPTWVCLCDGDPWIMDPGSWFVCLTTLYELIWLVPGVHTKLLHNALTVIYETRYLNCVLRYLSSKLWQYLCARYQCIVSSVQWLNCILQLLIMLLMITRIYSVLLPISFHVFVIRDLMKSRYLDLFRLNLSGITAATATYDIWQVNPAVLHSSQINWCFG